MEERRKTIGKSCGKFAASEKHESAAGKAIAKAGEDPCGVARRRARCAGRKLEAYQGCAPCQAGAESDEQHEIALFDFAAPHDFVEGDGYGRRRRVAVVFYVDVNLFGGNFEAFGDRLYYAGVRLVGNKERDVLRAHAALPCRPFSDSGGLP